jgi:hypothetical protein
MRKRDLRIGLHVKVGKKDGWEHGVTNWLDGDMVIEYFSVYGGEGYDKVDDLIKYHMLKNIKLVDRVYDPHER